MDQGGGTTPATPQQGNDAKRLQPLSLKSVTNDPMKMGAYTPRVREQTFAMEYQTSYNSMCKHADGRRSPIPPGYTGHQPGTLFKFGFGNPGTDRQSATPDPDAFMDARLLAPPVPGEVRSSSTLHRVPFDTHRIGSSAGASPRDFSTTPRTPRKSEAFSPRPESRGTPRSFFRATPPPAPTPTVGFQADEFPEEVKPVRYMEKKGRPTHFWPYYQPLGGAHLTPSPGCQYPPHPPDTVESRKMTSSYATAFLKTVKKAMPFGGGSESKKNQEKSNREGMAGGYENNFTPLNAAWMVQEGGTSSKQGQFSTSYKGAFTRSAVAPRRRKMRT